MLVRAATLASAMLFAATASAFAADANAPPPPIKGLWLATDFPSLTLHAGGDTTLPLTLYSYGLAPQRTSLSIEGAPTGWKAEIDGDGKPVGAAFVDYDNKANLSLKLDIPATAKPGPYNIVIKATGRGRQFRSSDRHRPRRAARGEADGDAATAGAQRHAALVVRFQGVGKERQFRRHADQSQRGNADRVRSDVQGRIRLAGTHQLADQGRRKQRCDRLHQAVARCEGGPIRSS